MLQVKQNYDLEIIHRLCTFFLLYLNLLIKQEVFISLPTYYFHSVTLYA